MESRKVPTENLPGIEINHRCQIKKATLEVEIGKIGCPDNLGSDRTEELDAVGIGGSRLLSVSWFIGRPNPAPVGFEAKEPHDAADALLIQAEFDGNPFVAITRMVSEDGPDLLEEKLILGWQSGLVVEGPSTDTEASGAFSNRSFFG